MKKTILAMILAFSTLAVAMPAQAQYLGSYCSARTTDGMWSFIFGPRPVEQNCAAARAGLARVTGAEIDAVESGLYRMHGINRVLTTCGFYYDRIITGVGSNVLQNAYLTARGSGLNYCLFRVNN